MTAEYEKLKEAVKKCVIDFCRILEDRLGVQVGGGYGWEPDHKSLFIKIILPMSEEEKNHLLPMMVGGFRVIYEYHNSEFASI